MSLRNNKKKLIAGVSIAALAGSYFLGPHLIKSYIESKYPFVKIQSARFIFIGICFDNIIVNKPNIKADIDKVCVKGIRGPLIVNGGHASLSIVENITHHHNDKNILDQFNEVYISGIDATVTKGNDSADLSGISYTKTNSEDYLAFESANIKYKEKKFDATGGKIRRDLSSAEIETVHTEFPLPFKIPHIDPPHSVIANKLHINIKGKVVKIADIRYGFLHIQNTEARLSLKDINASAQFVSIDHAWLASKPIVFTDATASSKPPFRDFDIALGEAKIHTDLVDYQASGFGSCSEWAKALPKPNILEKVADSFSGALSFTINVHPKPEFKLVNTCKFKCSNQPINNLFSPNGFIYSVYDKNNKPLERRIGPNEEGWASIEEISPDLLLAVNALEDPGFQGHKGVIPLAIKNSLLANLKEGKFAFVLLSTPRVAPGHLLIIPKRHVQRLSELNDREVKEIFELLGKYQDKILDKLGNGTEIRQNYKPYLENSETHVNHLHLHLVPRKETDEIATRVDIYRKPLYKELSEEEKDRILKLLAD